MADPARQADGIRLLLIEDNPAHARLIREQLNEVNDAQEGRPFELEQASRLSSALARLAGEAFDLILLDMNLPDGRGLDVLGHVHAAAPATPIVVLTAEDDTTLALDCVRQGAQDYIIKDRLQPFALGRCIRLALERHRAVEAVRQQSLADDQTGIFNRRGFARLVVQQVSLSRRRNQPFTLLFLGVAGRSDERAAMLEAAGLVTTVVRDSDVVGRISANELCVLLIDDSSEPPKAWERIQLALTAHNAGVIGVAPLELEGQVRYHRPDQPAAIDDLLSEESPARPERARRTRVLVIGPPEDAGIAAASFPPDDYSIFTTASGLEGGRLAVLERPDIVLLELSLPDVPGHSVLRRLREESATASLPVVLLTRPSDGYGEFEARRAGAQGVLVKPFNPAACRLAVHAALRGESPEAPAS